MAPRSSFASYVECSQRSYLESLVFFNASQQRVLDGIIDSIEKFGPPEIVEEGGRLRVRVAGKTEAQSPYRGPAHGKGTGGMSGNP